MACKRRPVRIWYPPLKRLRKGPLLFMGYTVYILYSELKDRYYVGQTENLEKRIAEHNLRKNLGANDWKLVYMEEYDTRSMAILREREIKSKKRREYIANLIGRQ